MIGKYYYQLIFSGLFFITVLFFSYFPQIGTSAEAREAHIASRMVESGDWLLPRRNGILPSKPPLSHWISASIAYLSGSERVSPFQARIPSVTMSALCLLVTGVFTSWLFQTASPDGSGKYGNGDRQSTAGLISMAFLATTYGFLSMSEVSLVDMTLCALTTSAVFIFIMNSTIPSGLYLLAFLAGLATMAKGPLGSFIPAVFTGCYLLCLGKGELKSKVLGNILSKHLFFSGILYCAIVLPWYAYAASVANSEFIGRQLVFENLKRMTGDEWITNKPWWFYFQSLISRGTPWIAILTALYLIRCLRIKNYLTDSIKTLFNGQANYLAYAFLAILFVFSLSAGKRSSYLLPLYPVLACLITFYNYERLLQFLKSAINNEDKVFFALTILLCSASVIFLFSGQEYFAELVYSKQVYSYFLILYALIMLGLQFLSKRYLAGDKSSRDKLLIFCCKSFFLFITCLTAVKVVSSEYKNYEILARRLSADADSSNKLHFVRHIRDEFFDPIFYYLGKEVSINDPKNPQFNAGDQVVLTKSWLDENPSYLPSLEFVNCYQFKLEKIEKRNTRAFGLFRYHPPGANLPLDSPDPATVFSRCFIS